MPGVASGSLGTTSCDLRIPPVWGRMSPVCKGWVCIAVNVDGEKSVEMEGMNQLCCPDSDNGPSRFSTFSKWEGEAGSTRAVPKTHGHLAPGLIFLLILCLPACSLTQVLGVWFAENDCLHFPWLCKPVALAKNSPWPEALSWFSPIGWLPFIFRGGVLFKFQSCDTCQCLLGVRYLEFRDPNWWQWQQTSWFSL